MEVLFEDENLIVAIKERGLLSEEHELKPTIFMRLPPPSNTAVKVL